MLLSVLSAIMSKYWSYYFLSSMLFGYKDNIGWHKLIIPCYPSAKTSNWLCF